MNNVESKDRGLIERELLLYALEDSLEPTVDALIEQAKVGTDLDDFGIIFREGTEAVIGIGKAETTNNESWAELAVKDALSHMLTERPVSCARAALISFTLGNDEDKGKTVKLMGKGVKLVQKAINPEARVVWTASTDLSLKYEARAFVVLVWDS